MVSSRDTAVIDRPRTLNSRRLSRRLSLTLGSNLDREGRNLQARQGGMQDTEVNELHYDYNVDMGSHTFAMINTNLILSFGVTSHEHLRNSQKRKL